MWWKAFENPAETNRFFPRQSLGRLWTVGYLIALCMLLGVMGTAGLPYLALPIVLFGLYLFLSYLTGLVGMVAFMPILTYAWLCLGWFLAYGIEATSQIAMLEGLLILLFVTIFLIGVPYVYAYLLIPVVAEGLFCACMSYAIFWILAPEAEVTYFGRPIAEIAYRIADFYFVGVNIVAAIVLLITFVTFVRQMPEHPEARRQGLLDLALVGMGFVPPVVGSLLSRLHPALGVAAALAGYAAIAVWGTRRKAECLGWALLPLMVLATVAVMAQAPTDYLPEYGPGIAIVRFVHDGPLGAAARNMAIPLMQAMAALFGKPIAHAVKFGIKAIERLGASLAQACIMPIIDRLVSIQGGADDVESSIQSLSNLVWGLKKLPKSSLVSQTLGTYLFAFASCAVMGTVAFFGGRRAKGGEQEAEKAPEVAEDGGRGPTVPAADAPEHEAVDAMSESGGEAGPNEDASLASSESATVDSDTP